MGMALIQCPECGRQVSDKARKCPHCGCPLEELEKKEPVKEKKKSEVLEKTPKEKKKLKQKDNYYNWYCTFITDTRWSDIFSYDC